MLFTCGSAQCSGGNKSALMGKRSNLLVASAFKSLSPEEQDRAHRDLYGGEVSDEETIEFIDSKLDGLDYQLSLLSDNVKKYYTRAIAMEKEQASGIKYIRSQKFRLMFLRAERFDTEKTAQKICAYFHEKYYLFGEEMLPFRIRQQDLSDTDLKALRCGAYCFTGETDTAGRPVVIVRRKESMKQDLNSMKRAIYYLVQYLVEDNDVAQKRGVVLILYNMHEAVNYGSTEVRRMVVPMPRMTRYLLPMKVAGLHNCYDDMKEQFVANLFLVVASKFTRASFQGHYLRTHEECTYTLMEYGINSFNLPFSADGEFDIEQVHGYLDKQRELESKF